MLVEQVTVHTQREVRGTVTEGSLYVDRLPLRTDQRKRYSRAYSGGSRAGGTNFAALPINLPRHPDQNGPERPILLAVDQ